MRSWFWEPDDVSEHPVVRSAMESACKLGHNYLGTEHLLLGVMANSGGMREILDVYGLDYAKVFSAICEIVGESESEPLLKWAPMTPRARKVCKGAGKNAKRNARSEIRVEDFFGAIVAEEDGVPHYLLNHRFDIDMDELRRRVAG